jgi:hypothetical protein
MELDSHKSLMMSINVIGAHLTEHSDDEARSADIMARVDKVSI